MTRREYKTKWESDWRKANPEKAKARQAKSVAANGTWADRHRDEWKAYCRRWWSKQSKYRTNQHFSKNLRTRMYLALKGLRKLRGSFDLIGCSFDALKRHIESQFKPGMTWGNYGQWHVDHKRPCAKFDLSSLEQQRACFHYTNLQPLWASDNIAKSCS